MFCDDSSFLFYFILFLLIFILFFYEGLRARHWGFLFRNLQQAVDEIYQTCEDDESIVECKVRLTLSLIDTVICFKTQFMFTFTI